ncbi:MAG: hypothetical protein ACSLFD_05335 [Solirubrobacterales bacterium]
MELLAYLDPGSASALLAAVLAGIAGAGAAIRTYGRKLMFWKKDEPITDGPSATTANTEATAGTATATPADTTDDKPSEK